MEEPIDLPFVEVSPYSGVDDGYIRTNVSLKKGDWFIGLDGKAYEAEEDRDDYMIRSHTSIWLPFPDLFLFGEYNLQQIMLATGKQRKEIYDSVSSRAKAYLKVIFDDFGGCI